MSPGTSFHFFHRAEPGENSGIARAIVIAVLFAVAAAISFAVDQSVTLSNPALAPQPQTTAR